MSPACRPVSYTHLPAALRRRPCPDSQRDGGCAGVRPGPLHEPDPGSYTHLDVYKRQAFSMELDKLPVPKDRDEARQSATRTIQKWSKPVSYTHLDVYKRQLPFLPFGRRPTLHLCGTSRSTACCFWLVPHTKMCIRDRSRPVHHLHGKALG